jgi:hypothetical protein
VVRAFARNTKKPGFPGLRYRCGPACGVAATHPSNPLRAQQRLTYGRKRTTARDFAKQNRGVCRRAQRFALRAHAPAAATLHAYSLGSKATRLIAGGN